MGIEPRQEEADKTGTCAGCLALLSRATDMLAEVQEEPDGYQEWCADLETHFHGAQGVSEKDCLGTSGEAPKVEDRRAVDPCEAKDPGKAAAEQGSGSASGNPRHSPPDTMGERPSVVGEGGTEPARIFETNEFPHESPPTGR